MAGGGDRVVKRDVVFRALGQVVLIGGHCLRERDDFGGFFIGARRCCERGSALFDGAAYVPNVRHGDLCGRDGVLQRCGDNRAVECADAWFAAVADVDQFQRRERAERFAHDGAADAQRFGKVAFAGQSIADAEAMTANMRRHGVYRSLHECAALSWLQSRDCSCRHVVIPQAAAI